MRKGLLGAFAGLLAGTSLALGQPEATVLPGPMAPATQAVADGSPPDEMPPEDLPVEAVPPGGATPDGGAPRPLGLDGPPGPHHRVWFSAEYLLWWFKGQQPPPLVTTGPAVSVEVAGPPPIAVPAPGVGAIGTDGTRVLFGGEEINKEAQSGGRFTGGLWLDDDHCYAVEGNYFFFGDRSNQSPFGPELGVLARPFFNLNTGAEDAAVVSFGQSRGNILVSTPSSLWGAEGNFVKKLCACDFQYQVSCLGGFRFLDLQEAIGITQSQGIAAGLPPTAQFSSLAGQHLVLADRFAAENQFYGGQLGLDGACYLGPWSLEVRGKLGLGDTHETLAVLGTQTATPPGGPTTVTPGGLLALPGNSGRFTRDTFALVPEATVHVGYRLCNKLCVFAGYDFLYWSRVVRPDDQIDRVLDVSRVPNFAAGAAATGVARPASPFKQTDFWAQGLDVGLEFIW